MDTQKLPPMRVRIGEPESRKNGARNEQVTRIEVFDDIGGDGWGGGISAGDFSGRLAAVKGSIEVHINSGGGDVFDGIAIANAIRDRKGKVTTVVDGLAASIASVIAQAGQTRIVQPGGMLMIHEAFGGCLGNASEMTQMSEVLDKVSDNIATIYSQRSGRDKAYWRDQMKAETWYTADEAVQEGLADRVGDDPATLPAGVDIAAFTAVPGRIAAALRSLPAAAATHEPMTGTHSHPHPAYGSQGGDSMHAHEHTHSNDASHTHSHADDDGDGEPDGTQDRAAVVVLAGGAPRILGIESMPLADRALPVHHTATTDTAWDGPAAVAAMPNDDTVLKYCHAWEDSDAASVPHRENDDDADDQKANYKFPHHTARGGPANLAACRNGLARLTSASIPPGDDGGVRAHLEAHLKDGGGHPGGEDHQDHDISGLDLETLANALKGALA